MASLPRANDDRQRLVNLLQLSRLLLLLRLLLLPVAVAALGAAGAVVVVVFLALETWNSSRLWFEALDVLLRLLNPKHIT